MAVRVKRDQHIASDPSWVTINLAPSVTALLVRKGWVLKIHEVDMPSTSATLEIMVAATSNMTTGMMVERLDTIKPRSYTFDPPIEIKADEDKYVLFNYSIPSGVSGKAGIVATLEHMSKMSEPEYETMEIRRKLYFYLYSATSLQGIIPLMSIEGQTARTNYYVIPKGWCMDIHSMEGWSGADVLAIALGYDSDPNKAFHFHEIVPHAEDWTSPIQRRYKKPIRILAERGDIYMHLKYMGSVTDHVVGQEFIFGINATLRRL